MSGFDPHNKILTSAMVRDLREKQRRLEEDLRELNNSFQDICGVMQQIADSLYVCFPIYNVIRCRIFQSIKYIY